MPVVPNDFRVILRFLQIRRQDGDRTILPERHFPHPRRPAYPLRLLPLRYAPFPRAVKDEGAQQTERGVADVARPQNRRADAEIAT